jgi:hypothetical protein
VELVDEGLQDDRSGGQEVGALALHAPHAQALVMAGGHEELGQLAHGAARHAERGAQCALRIDSVCCDDPRQGAQRAATGDGVARALACEIAEVRGERLAHHAADGLALPAAHGIGVDELVVEPGHTQSQRGLAGDAVGVADGELQAAPAQVHTQCRLVSERNALAEGRQGEPRLLLSRQDAHGHAELPTHARRNGITVVRVAQRRSADRQELLCAELQGEVLQLERRLDRPRADVLGDAAVLRDGRTEPQHHPAPRDTLDLAQGRGVGDEQVEGGAAQVEDCDAQLRFAARPHRALAQIRQ